MTKRISRGILAVAFLTLLLCYAFMLWRLRGAARDSLRASLEDEAAVIVYVLDNGGELPPVNTLVTRTAPDGSVTDNGYTLATNSVVTVTAALADGSAVTVSDDAPSFSTLLADLLLPAGLTAVPILLLAAFLSVRISKKIVAPISTLDPEHPVRSVDGYPELTPWLSKIVRQNELIGKQMDDMRRHQEEFRAITENMDEGFVLVDRKTEILSYNKSALRLLSGRAGEEDDFSLSRSPAFRAAVGEALGGRHNEKLLEIDGKSYQLIANPVLEAGQTDGAVVVILDVTERRQREQMRREFTSNVSHELKTPLTSIYGIADMLSNSLVRQEDIPRFADDIRRESGRLISLVEDTIKLSQMDEDSIPYEREPVDLYAAASEVIERLTPAAAAAEVTLHLEGGPQTVEGIPSILSEILSNLCDNAIKYNRAGGSVTVRVAEEDGRPTVTVSDTGIGIPKEHLDRVCERFYRVDKSHSKAIGGTGLGLSIVKHGVAYHGADMRIESEVGVGTTVRIRF